MWELVLDALRNKMIMICTVLTFVIPFCINFINRKLHEVGDPPWKKDE
ncbi:MAG TPA: hypothetical protein VK111_11685 [Virgibacillus sp.]|nr:hypothetical protein [Virgibacillus sp.]